MLKSTLRILTDLDIFTKTPIIESDITEENKPYVIKNGEYGYYHINTHNFTEEDIRLQLMAQQTYYLQNIKSILSIILVVLLIPVFLFVISLAFSL